MLGSVTGLMNVKHSKSVSSNINAKMSVSLKKRQVTGKTGLDQRD